jgi:hypothetical protein
MWEKGDFSLFTNNFPQDSNKKVLTKFEGLLYLGSNLFKEN